ncbi:bile acid:sodium symporter [Nesterenkonia sp. CL21]|uniref:arsenic resistance protein n=1 Tax=Nesterenkonia sp. CL21 TaxID=3064894 RepID=UPI0028788DC5|nr:bile acid:sodium symporter [Nesterenkonia sp. CL21]MDS2174127.1 bile acid:sodium symporter [Nesterenkonia sp. CL21]
MRVLSASPPWLFLLAIAGGLLLGLTGSDAAWAEHATDPLIMLLLGLVFLELRVGGARELLRSRRAAVVALVLNMLVLPAAALGLVTLLVPDSEAVRLGLLIYLLFPCTDWFLGFTRVAGGNAVLGAALIPVSLVLQLLLYPVWISLVTGRSLPGVMEALWPAVTEGLLIPAAAAVLVRLLVGRAAGRDALAAVQRAGGAALPWVIAALILVLFAAGASEAVLVPWVFVQVLIVVALFFALSMGLAVAVSRRAALAEPDLILVIFTTAARNAPLMLAVTALVLGEDPVVTAVIVLGMLLEFPHLAAVSWWMRRRRRRDRRRSRRLGVAEPLTAAS